MCYHACAPLLNICNRLRAAAERRGLKLEFIRTNGIGVDSRYSLRAAKKKRRRKSAVDAAAISKAKAAPMPGYIEPSLATATETAPSGKDWLHEIKHDGYRLQAHVREGAVSLYTNHRGNDWALRMPTIAAVTAGCRSTHAMAVSPALRP